VKLAIEISMYAVFIAVLAVLSAWPPYQLLDDEISIVSMVFAHAGERVGECRRISQEELNDLPPNMRKPADCPRERHPVRVEIRSGGDVLYSEVIQPSGIWADGKASIYKRIEVRSGRHELFVGMNDSGGAADFDYTTFAVIDLSYGRNLVIQFDEQKEEFSIR
jgi:hypothetical protein